MHAELVGRLLQRQMLRVGPAHRARLTRSEELAMKATEAVASRAACGRRLMRLTEAADESADRVGPRTVVSAWWRTGAAVGPTPEGGLSTGVS